MIRNREKTGLFAVTEFMKPIYEKLAEFLGQEGNVGILPKIVNKKVDDNDKDKLKDLIKNQYESIRSRLLRIEKKNDFI